VYFSVYDHLKRVLNNPQNGNGNNHHNSHSTNPNSKTDENSSVSNILTKKGRELTASRFRV